MAGADFTDLRARADRAFDSRAATDHLYREAFQYAMPQRQLYDRPTAGQKKGTELFDSTAINSTRRFVDKLIDGLFPPFQRWFELTPGPLVHEDAREQMTIELQGVADVAHAMMQNASNFQSAIGEYGYELAAGTGVMLSLKGPSLDQPLIYRTMSQATVGLEEGPFGTVGAIFRRFKMPAHVIKREWPDAKLPGPVVEMLAQAGARDTMVDLIECTYEDAPRWYYDVICDIDESFVVRRTRKFREWIVTRWTKIADEVMGRGLLLDALPDIKSLNAMVGMILKNANIAAAGVYTATDDGITNPRNIRLQPGAVNIVARNPGHPQGPSLAALDTARSFDLAQLERVDMRQGVREMLLDRQLPPDAGPVRSATEIVERMRALQQDTGAAYGRLMTELYQPLILSTVQILHEWGLVKYPAKALVFGGNLSLTITTPLGRAQQINDASSIVNYVQTVMTLLGPQLAALAIKLEDIPELLAEKMGADRRVLRSKDERKQLQQAVTQMLAQSAAAQQQQQGQIGPGGIAAPPPGAEADQADAEAAAGV